MKRACQKYESCQFEAPNIEEWVFMAVWIFGKFKGFIWKILLVSKSCSPVTFSHTNLFVIFKKILTVIKIHSLMPGTSNLAILPLSERSFHFWYPFLPRPILSIFMIGKVTWPRACWPKGTWALGRNSRTDNLVPSTLFPGLGVGNVK